MTVIINFNGLTYYVFLPNDIAFLFFYTRGKSTSTSTSTSRILTTDSLILRPHAPHTPLSPPSYRSLLERIRLQRFHGAKVCELGGPRREAVARAIPCVRVVDALVLGALAF